MKKIMALILCLTMVFALCACSGTSAATETDKPAESDTPKETSAAAGSVYWLNSLPEADQVLQDIAKMYTEKTGVKVTVLSPEPGTYDEVLSTEMDKSYAPTIFVIGDQAAMDIWGDFCYDLTGTPVAEELSTDIYNFYDDFGGLCAIGCGYECHGIIVNKALLQQAGHSAEEITNFDSLKAVAEDIHARAEELGFDAFTSSGMSPDSSWRFTGNLANLEYYYESLDDPLAWEQIPAQIKGTYMGNFKNLWDLYINNSAAEPSALAAGGFDAKAEFLKGQAVFYSQGSGEWSSLQEQGMNAGDLTMIPYYCGVAGEERAGLSCGTDNCWAVNAEASDEEIQATLDFMYWCVTDPDASGALVEAFGAMPYKQAAEPTNPFLAKAKAYIAAGNYIMPYIASFQPNADSYREALVSAMNQYDADPTDENWELVRAAFVDGWAEQYKAIYG